ncbi:MAG: tRNA (adenosine(37)-N6)-threonylcarbamoyltransferase complex dimerization subunit type 1 TsaB [Gammaproteobacteria bacterium]|nr:tRNA (adenosine(37)-N6)-threonylcarbamoyltransferase complex dimerization subunit type 1 TsaB [Gammaproteobacteria bacterium]MYF02415.1 tRNA (adenosine(37)-N6)-threonylcarbamoyltransferase complex dimerization subunit type 1 TsaB [Gammaproteobacteria bacterium]MYI77871.1 tRNA (adenosine(37)-N6)-threonylcarbamoyltransferase complex dimerization subunit type 1 TsaB [Gammaproteobacteria bacterium]
MCQVLALETTSDVCSVAVNIGSKIACHSLIAPRKHNEFILKMVDELLESNDVQRVDLDLVAFSAGPGSFTGVRLGASIAQGIALGLGINVVVIPTSAAMALQVRQLHPERQTCTLVRWSRRGWYYVAQFRWKDDVMECVHEDKLVAEEDVPTTSDVVTDKQITLRAQSVLDLAQARKMHSVLPEQALPLYLVGDSPYQVKSGQ